MKNFTLFGSCISNTQVYFIIFIGSIITSLPVTDGPSTTTDNSKQILGISLGVVLFGVAVVILAVVVVVVVMVMRTKRKGMCIIFDKWNRIILLY